MRSLATLLISLHAATLALGQDSLATQARGVLEKHCHSCHGQGGSDKGGFGFVLDRQRLVAQQKLIPGKPADSELWQRIDKDEMPPAKRPRLDAAERKTLRAWIEAGAPWPQAERPPVLSEQALGAMLERDRAALQPRLRPLMRYVSFTSLANGGASGEELLTARQALNKLLNSLSWHPRIGLPHDVEGRGVLFRIDLRDYQWTARHWERLVNVNPYRKTATAETTVLRGDWLIATASRAPLYYDLLEMPTTDRGLERLLRVDVPRNIREDNVIRAGFNDSGVSKNNRVLERHHAAHGAYWRSYDFSNNLDRQNIFQYPLGPFGATAFKAAGGEVIFHLPNGLHGYLLVDGDGQRVNKGPVEIVSDPKRPDRAVEAGLSCMSCHAGGFLPKEDQVRAHAEKNARAFRAEDLDTIRALYPPAADFRKRLDEDNARFLDALKKTGAPPAPDNEPVTTVTLRYEGTLDLARTAAELGLTPEELLARLKKAPGLQRLIGALADRKGTVQRQLIEENFDRLLRELGLEATASTSTTPVPSPFQGHRGGVTALAWSPDGTKVATGGPDETARLWKADGQALRTLEGHRGEVAALAWSPDGRLLATAAGRVVRLWVVSTGELTARLEGHTDRLRSVVFSPDGKTLASAGDDAVVRLWNVSDGKETAALAGHEGAVLCLAYSPNGKHLLSGGADRSVRLWELSKGKQKSAWSGHERPVHSLIFAPDGRRAVSASADGTLLVWNVGTGKQTLALSGHRNPVVALAWTEGVIVSAASQHDADDPVLRLWDARTGALLSRHDIRGRVWCATFTPNATTALLGGPDAGLKSWRP